MDLNKKNVRTILLIITFAVAAHWLFQNLGYIPDTIRTVTSFLSPFIIGCAIAYILNLPTRFLENILFRKEWKKGDSVRQRIKRPISMILATILVLGAFIGVMVIVIPQLITALQTLIADLPNAIARAQTWLDKFEFDSPDISNFIDSIGYSIQELSSSLTKWLTQTAGTLINATLEYSVTLIRFLVSFFIGLIFSFYLIMKKEKIGMQANALLYAVVPESRADNVRTFFTRSNRVFSSFLSGQVLEAGILGVLMTVTLIVFDFPYALLIGVLIGITAVIPILGGWIGGVVGAILELTVSPMTMVYYIIVFLVVQQFEGNVIYPRMVGKKVGLPAIWVLVAVTLGASLGGVFGAFISIPVASVIYEYMSDMVARRLKKNRISADKLMPADSDVKTSLIKREAGETRLEKTDAGQTRKEPEQAEKSWWDRVLDALKRPQEAQKEKKEAKSRKNGDDNNNDE